MPIAQLHKSVLRNGLYEYGLGQDAVLGRSTLVVGHYHLYTGHYQLRVTLILLR